MCSAKSTPKRKARFSLRSGSSAILSFVKYASNGNSSIGRRLRRSCIDMWRNRPNEIGEVFFLVLCDTEREERYGNCLGPYLWFLPSLTLEAARNTHPSALISKIAGQCQHQVAPLCPDVDEQTSSYLTMQACTTPLPYL